MEMSRTVSSLQNVEGTESKQRINRKRPLRPSCDDSQICQRIQHSNIWLVFKDQIKFSMNPLLSFNMKSSQLMSQQELSSLET